MLLTSAPSGGGDAYQIEKSLRFSEDDDANLVRKFRKGNRRTWTLNFWYKRTTTGQQGSSDIIFGCGPDASNTLYLYMTATTLRVYNAEGGSNNVSMVTKHEFRDAGAWMMHTLAVDTTQAASTDRLRYYINGEEITSWEGATYPAQYAELQVNKNVNHYLGRYHDGDADPLLDGYLADVQFIDGVKLSPASFGSFDSKGIFNPKAFKLSSPNKGTTWSSGGDGNIESARPWSKGFDGIYTANSTSDQYTRTNDTSTAAVWTAPGGGLAFTTLRILGCRDGGNGGNQILVNGKAMSGFNTSNTHDWNDISSQVSSPLTTITLDPDSGQPRFMAVEVDGVILVDGQTDLAVRYNSPNDGTTWSDGWSGDFFGNYTGVKSFDGKYQEEFVADETTRPDTGDTVTWTAPHSIAFTKLEISAMHDNVTTDGVKVNDTDVSTAVTNNLGWTDITSSISSPLTEIKLKSVGSGRPSLFAVRVDGHVLIDSNNDNSFHLKFNDIALHRYLGKDTLNGKIADATGGKPILKTSDDFGDVKDSGTATDSDSANLLLAVPFDTTTPTDYHATIKGSGTNRTMTTSTSNVAYAATTDARFYGSAANMATGTGGGTNVSGVTTTTSPGDFELGTGDFTLEFWAKWDPETTTNSYIFSLEKTGGASPYPLYIFRKSNGAINNWNNDFDLEQFSNAGSDGTWHHYALVRHNSGKTFTGYIDGRKDTEIVRSSAYSIPANVDKVSIGHYSNAYNVNGLLQDVRFYNKAKYSSNFKTPARNDFTVNNFVSGTSTGVTTGGVWNTAFRDGNGGSWNAADVHEISTGATLSTAGNSNRLYIDTAALGDAYELTITDTGGANAIYFAEQANEDPAATGSWNLVQNNITKLILTAGGANCDGTGKSHKRYVRCEGAGGGHCTMTITGVLDLDAGTSGSARNIDSLMDSPTSYGDEDTGVGGEIRSNYCTLNPVDMASNIALTQGNLRADISDNTKMIRGTVGVQGSGKWYFEVECESCTNDNNKQIGVHPLNIAKESYVGGSKSVGYHKDGRTLYDGQQTGTTGSTWGTGDVIGVALDLSGGGTSNGKVTFYKNGTAQSNGILTTLDCTKFYTVAIARSSAGSGNSIFNLNTGQRPFKHAAPTDHKCLCTHNLPDLFSNDALNDPSYYFDVPKWFGTGSNQSISNLNFSPDLVWVKNRDSGDSHNLADSVRGAGKQLWTNNNEDGYTYTNSINSLDSNGFTVGTNGNVNTNSNKYVAFTWDAGTAASGANTDGTINVASGDQWVNNTSGFSITKYSGNGSNSTIGHGLSARPDVVIIKNIDADANWAVGFYTLGFTNYLHLNNTNAMGTNISYFNNADTDVNIVNVGTAATTNTNGNEYIMYCWTPIPSFSSFGEYTGTGDTNGEFIFTGFQPKWLLIKCCDGHNWVLKDTTRNIYNPSDGSLLADGTNVETDWNIHIDILSNGFKPRAADSNTNKSGEKHVYMAFAEHPQKLSRAR